jgi:hypothetical protein
VREGHGGGRGGAVAAVSGSGSARPGSGAGAQRRDAGAGRQTAEELKKGEGRGAKAGPRAIETVEGLRRTTDGP